MTEQHGSMPEGHKKDNWSSDTYTAAANFVPKLTTRVLSLLDAQPNDHILDLGCGDGHLTSNISSTLAMPYQITGLDASPSMISSASKLYPSLPFAVQDCTQLPSYLAANPHLAASFTAVFSNAAMHWILAAPTTRASFFEAVHAALAPGGRFVFEMGGAGNVAEVHASAIGALRAHGVSLEDAVRATPWVFPSEKWMRAALEEAGLAVEVLELEYRPTELTNVTKDGKGGLEGWIRLMCADWLAIVSQEKRGAVVRWMVENLEGVMKREEDGSWWVGYVRLRGVARKSAD